MSFADLFKTKAPEPVAAPANTDLNNSTPAAQPAGTGKLANVNPSVEPKVTEGTAPNGAVPNNPETPESPLAQFEKLWETDPNAEKPAEFKPQQLDQAKLQEIMSKVNLTQVITSENLAAIQAGGEGAAEAFTESMNAVAQQTLMQSTVVANKMVEQAVSKTMEAMEAKIPGLVKEQALNNTLTEQNPIYSNPAVKPVIDAVKTQLATKFPAATPTELATMAQDFVKAMNASLTPAAPETKDAAGNDTDWSSFIEDNQF